MPTLDDVTSLIARFAPLEQLTALHQSGALTDDEFAAQKQQILGPA